MVELEGAWEVSLVEKYIFFSLIQKHVYHKWCFGLGQSPIYDLDPRSNCLGNTMFNKTLNQLPWSNHDSLFTVRLWFVNHDELE